MFYAGYLLSVKELRREFSTATIMTWSGAVSCLVLLPVTLLSGGGLLPSSAAGWWVLLGLALVSHFGGQSLIAFALAKLPAAFRRWVCWSSQSPRRSSPGSILSEALNPWQALGGALALAGIFVARRASLMRHNGAWLVLAAAV